MSNDYRVEQMSGTPDDLKAILPEECWMDGGWCIVRNHDDELRATFGSREEAEEALSELGA